MGRSNPDEEVCRQTPRSADPENYPKMWISNHSPKCETFKQSRKNNIPSSNG